VAAAWDEEFWDARLSGAREGVVWEKVLRLLVVNRLLDPGGEFRVHRQWYQTTAMDALLGTDFAVAEKDRLYRCLDRLLTHKQELFLWLRQKWADLVGTPKSKIQEYEKKWLDLAWQKVRESVEVKLLEQDGELYVLAKSDGRKAKETAMRRKRLARFLKKLRARLGAAKSQAGRACHFVEMQLPGENQKVSRTTFQFRVSKKKLQEAEWRDGHYPLRSNLTERFVKEGAYVFITGRRQAELDKAVS